MAVLYLKTAREGSSNRLAISSAVRVLYCSGQMLRGGVCASVVAVAATSAAPVSLLIASTDQCLIVLIRLPARRVGETSPKLEGEGGRVIVLIVSSCPSCDSFPRGRRGRREVA
jgi:hypothetical protein